MSRGFAKALGPAGMAAVVLTIVAAVGSVGLAVIGAITISAAQSGCTHTHFQQNVAASGTTTNNER